MNHRSPRTENRAYDSEHEDTPAEHEEEEVEDVRGTLFYCDGADSKIGVLASLAAAPDDVARHRAMCKRDPPFLYLMNEHTYLEFPLFNVLFVRDGQSKEETEEGDEGVEGEDGGWGERVFHLQIAVEGSAYDIWLAAEDAEAKLKWIVDLEHAVEASARPAPHAGSGAGRGRGTSVSWEIDPSHISIGRMIGAGQFGGVFKGQVSPPHCP
jgi:hypothetical protein